MEELLGSIIDKVVELFPTSSMGDTAAEAVTAMKDSIQAAAPEAYQNAESYAEDGVQIVQDVVDLVSGDDEDGVTSAFVEGIRVAEEIAADAPVDWEVYGAVDNDTGTVQLSGEEDFGPITVPAKVILQWNPSKPILPVPAQGPAKPASLKYLAAIHQIIAFTANSNTPGGDLHVRAQAVLHIAVGRLADELGSLKTISGAIPELKYMARRMITSACVQTFIQIYWNTLNFLLLKYRADAVAKKTETSQWIRDLENVVEVMSDGRSACKWDFTGQVQNYGVQCFDEVSGPYIMHMLNSARAIANKQQVQHKESIFCVLDMHEALVRKSQSIEALFSAKKQLIRCTTESILERMADRVIAVLAKFETQVLADASPVTPKMNLIVHGKEIHPLTTDVMNYATSLVKRRAALDVLLKSGDVGDEGSAGEDDKDEVVSSCGRRVRLLISNLKANLREKAESYSYTPIGAGFLCRNLSHMLDQVRKSDIEHVIGVKWVNNNLDQELFSAQKWVATSATKSVFYPTVKILSGGML